MCQDREIPVWLRRIRHQYFQTDDTSDSQDFPEDHEDPFLPDLEVDTIQATRNFNYNLGLLITVSHLLNNLTIFLIIVRPGQVDQAGLLTNTKISF